MKYTNYFLHSLFLCAFFSCSITTAIASEEKEEKIMRASLKIRTHALTINSFTELPDLFKELGITWDASVAAFIDFDETTASFTWRSHIQRGDAFNPFHFLCSPDLERSYKKVLKSAAVLLHKENSDFSVKDYKEALLAANTKMIVKDIYRHYYTPLEKDSLKTLIKEARSAGTYLKICSGLSLTSSKIAFFAEHKEDLAFTIPSPSDYKMQGNDYLWASEGKAKRILSDLRKNRKNSPLKTVILFDNAPSACKRFLKDMTPKALGKIKGLFGDINVISVQYDFYKNKITPQLVADEFKRYKKFIIDLEAQREYDRNNPIDSDEDNDYIESSYWTSSSAPLTPRKEGTSSPRRPEVNSPRRHSPRVVEHLLNQSHGSDHTTSPRSTDSVHLNPESWETSDVTQTPPLTPREDIFSDAEEASSDSDEETSSGAEQETQTLLNTDEHKDFTLPTAEELRALLKDIAFKDGPSSSENSEE